MPNVVVVMRDSAHIIRTSCRDPLHDGALFSEQHDRLFGDQGVVKDFHYSTKCQDMMEASQRRFLEEGGSLGGVQHSVRHLDFVQPRFESFAVPRRWYVCLLRAIAQVIVMKAGDTREKGNVRQRFEAALRAMIGKDCFVAGLAGDYGEMCVHFLRFFIVHDHNPARTTTELHDVVNAMHWLLLQ